MVYFASYLGIGVLVIALRYVRARLIASRTAPLEYILQLPMALWPGHGLLPKLVAIVFWPFILRAFFDYSIIAEYRRVGIDGNGSLVAFGGSEDPVAIDGVMTPVEIDGAARPSLGGDTAIAEALFRATHPEATLPTEVVH